MIHKKGEKWLVLDAHGVLLPSSEKWILKKLSKQYRIPLMQLQWRWLMGHMSSQNGKTPSRKFYSQILQTDLSKSQFENQIMRPYAQRGRIPKLIVKQLARLKKAGWKLAIFSNMNEAQAHFHREKQTFKGFDEVFLSWELREMKPFPDFFLHLQQKLHTPSNHILFIDDHWENVVVGMRLGWHAVKLKEPLEAWAFLNDLK